MLVLIAIPAGLTLFGLLGLLALLPATVFLLAVWRSVITALDLAPPDGSDADADAAVDPPDLPDGVPLWLERVAQWSWRGLVLAALAGLVIWLVVQLPQVVVPTVIAVVFAATLLPVVDSLERRGWGRGLASAVSTLGVIVFVVVSVGAAIALTIGPMHDVIAAAAAGAAELDLEWLRDAILDAGSGLELDVAALLVRHRRGRHRHPAVRPDGVLLPARRPDVVARRGRPASSPIAASRWGRRDTGRSTCWRATWWGRPRSRPSAASRAA